MVGRILILLPIDMAHVTTTNTVTRNDERRDAIAAILEAFPRLARFAFVGHQAKCFGMALGSLFGDYFALQLETIHSILCYSGLIDKSRTVCVDSTRR